MGKVLNFGENEKKRINKYLGKFKKNETKTPYEELRVRIENSTVTLYHTGKITIQGSDANNVKEKILQDLKLTPKISVGIDEVARSEHLGPFCIGIVLGDKNELREFRDSKKTKNIIEKIELLDKSLLDISIRIHPKYLDLLHNRGLTIDQMQIILVNSIANGLTELEPNVKIRMDGKKMKNANNKIEFLVKGDDLDPVIGAASILAKNSYDKSSKERRETWKEKKIILKKDQ